MERLQPYFPKSRGRARVDDRRVLIGIIFINRNGLRWCDAPAEYGPPKTQYNRWKRWSDISIFARTLMGLAEQAPDNKTIAIDATYLKAHPLPGRTCKACVRGATSCLRLKKGARTPDRVDQERYEYKATCCHRHQRTSNPPLHHSRTNQ
jgi:transposase